MLRHPSGVRRCIVLSSALLLGIALFAVGAGAQQAEQRQLSAAQERLSQLAAELDAAEGDAAGAQDALRQAEAALAEAEEIVNEVALDVERQRGVVADARDRLRAVEQEAEALSEAFADRIARLYMQGPELTFEVLLSSDGADEAIARTTLLERLTEGDTVDLERLAAAQVAVSVEGDRLLAEQELLEERLEEQEQVVEQADALRDSRAGALAEAEGTVAEIVGEQDDLEAEEARLETLIREIEAEQERERERQRQAERERQRQAEAAAAAA
ncbi:MAG: hypothetical protein JJT89_14515, partial [Nitriliruptoraceae bacterium]|nr:hypothetical protein [Nitriliruptoraceae bacterium]